MLKPIEALKKIEIIKGDITKLRVDAIVNAANTSLLGGGGVDGAIHREAGFKLLKECKQLNGCSVGEAKITGGYLLPAEYVIHTVGPVYTDNPISKSLLTECYSNCMRLALDNKVKSIAFPAISCGVYGYPIDKACKIAVDTVGEYLIYQNEIDRVIFVLFSEGDMEVYNNYIKEIKNFIENEKI